MHRRSKDDMQWQQVKAKVDIRDSRQCRFLSILLPAEAEELKKLNPPLWMLQQIDHAHVKPVGNYLENAYDIDNVYCLCRWAHTHIDNLINPLTNNNMEINEQWYWWVRIRFKKAFQYDCKIDYQQLYDNLEKNQNKEQNIIKKWW